MKRILTVIFLTSATLASAQSYQAGLHSGALGAGNESGIGFGAHISVHPGTIASFRVDLTTAKLDSGSYLGSSPGVVFYGINWEEMKVGWIIGPGFYSIPGTRTRFGLHSGAVGEFLATKNLLVGMEGRYVATISEPKDVWWLFLTASYQFEGSGDW